MIGRVGALALGLAGSIVGCEPVPVQPAQPAAGLRIEWIDPATVPPGGVLIYLPAEGTVYLHADTVYGPCELIEPHAHDLAGWLYADRPLDHACD